VGRWFTPRFAADHPDVVARMRAMIASTPPDGYAACCEVVATTDLRTRLGGIDVSTLVVAGRRDPSVPAEDAEALAREIPRARLAVVDAAHLANVERADEVTGLIRGHLLGSEEGA